MIRAVMIAAALASGCATSWIVVQATGSQRLLDEGVREVAVPQPGIEERLNVSLPLDGGSLQCTTDQRATNTVYHSAFRYGKQWKIWSGVMTLVEGALAAVFLAEHDDKPEYIAYGGALGIDAVVSAALFLIPRKEVYRVEPRGAFTHVRSDCPDGMTLVIGDDRYPVDAAGNLGELGTAALDAWMSAPAGSLVLEAAGQARRFEIGAAEVCRWQHTLHPQVAAPTPQPQPMCYATPLLSVMVSIEVPAGMLTAM